MPRPRKSTAASDARTSAPNVSDRLSPVRENYLLSLCKMWESAEAPTLTQLTEALRQLPPRRIGNLGAIGGRDVAPDGEAGPG